MSSRPLERRGGPFNHLIGEIEHASRHGEAQDLGSFEVDDQREFRRVLNWEVGGTSAPEDPIDESVRGGSRLRPPLRDRKFSDSLLEGAGFEPSIPLLRKALLGLPIGDGGMKGGATYRFRSETAMLAWSGCP